MFLSHHRSKALVQAELKTGYTPFQQRAAGFTLIELLVVIAIIGILASVVLVSLNGARVNSRNATRVAQVQEYIKAIELAFYDNNNSYPVTNGGASVSPNVGYCFGNYDDDTCGISGANTQENAAFNTLLSTYMSSLPPGETVSGNNDFEGYVYSLSDDNPKTYFIYYALEGENTDCILEGATGQSTGFYAGMTFCTYERAS